jgi:hypothetical protein
MGFNAILRRTEYATETLWDWWVWGARAIVAPVMSLLIASFALVLFSGARHLLRGASSRVRQFDDGVRRRVAAWANRLSMDDVSVLSSWLFLLSTIALVATWSYFWSLMAAFGTPAPTATSDQLALLSPAFREHHNAYRQALTLIVLLTTAGWYGVFKVSALRHQPLKASLAVGGAAVLGLALVSLVLPYRLLYQNRFELATWDNKSCYVMGEKDDKVLLFCPGLEPVRNTAVPRTEVVRTGADEGVFTRFGRR